jgi:hypothetical protein
MLDRRIGFLDKYDRLGKKIMELQRKIDILYKNIKDLKDKNIQSTCVNKYTNHWKDESNWLINSLSELKSYPGLFLYVKEIDKIDNAYRLIAKETAKKTTSRSIARILNNLCKLSSQGLTNIVNECYDDLLANNYKVAFNKDKSVNALIIPFCYQNLKPITIYIELD